MSQIIEMPSPFTPAMVTTVKAEIVIIQAVMDLIKVSMTESQTKGLITVSTNKEAIIKAVFTDIMDPYPALMSSGVTVAQFAAMTQEEADTNTLIGLLEPVLTILKQHSGNLKNNRMYITTDTFDNAKLAGKKDPQLNLKVKSLQKTYYSRGQAKPVSEYTMTVSSKLVLGGVKTGTPIVNTGQATFSYIKVNGNVALTITVYPG